MKKGILMKKVHSIYTLCIIAVLVTKIKKELCEYTQRLEEYNTTVAASLKGVDFSSCGRYFF